MHTGLQTSWYMYFQVPDPEGSTNCGCGAVQVHLARVSNNCLRNVTEWYVLWDRFLKHVRRDLEEHLHSVRFTGLTRFPEILSESFCASLGLAALITPQHRLWKLALRALRLLLPGGTKKITGPAIGKLAEQAGVQHFRQQMGIPKQIKQGGLRGSKRRSLSE